MLNLVIIKAILFRFHDQIHFADLEEEDIAPIAAKVRARLKQPPWNYTQEVEQVRMTYNRLLWFKPLSHQFTRGWDNYSYWFRLLQFSNYIVVLADATYLWLTLVNETLAEGGDIRDGAAIALRARNRSFKCTSLSLTSCSPDIRPLYRGLLPVGWGAVWNCQDPYMHG